MSNMTEARVFELIEAYGPEPAAWPEAERETGAAFLRGAPETFAEAVAEARLLDAALGAMPQPQAPTGLAERIIASAPQRATRAGPGILPKLKSVFSIGGSLIPSASALASSALGLVIGYSVLGTTQMAEVDYAEEAIYAAFDDGYDFDLGDFDG